MIELGLALTATISIVAIVVALKRPGGCVRYSFLCGALYLAWVVPQVFALSMDDMTPSDGLFWLVIMVVLCLGGSLLGWKIGMRRRPRVSIQRDNELARVFWPVAVLTGMMLALNILIGLQPVEDRQQTQWSGPLTIIAFFLSLTVVGLFLSLRIMLRERSLRAFLLAGLNVVLVGGAAFVGLRRGEMIDFGIAGAAAMWFGARKTVPVIILIAAFIGMAAVTYAIGPLRSAANEIAARKGSSAGLLSAEVWKQVDFAAEIENSARRSPDFANATFIIDYCNRWREFTYGQQSWDRLIFHWVPAQIVGVDTKKALMFKGGTDYERLEAEYGYDRIGGTTATGFGFSYQEFGPFGVIYFILIGFLMARMWSDAEAGDLWAQVLYVSFAGNALLSVTHHPMRLFAAIPLFLLAIFILRRIARRSRLYQRSDGRSAFARR